jgi:hypothetical protein
MAYKFLKENGYPVDLIFKSIEIKPADENSWKDTEISVIVNGKFLEFLYCKKYDYSTVIKSYQKGFFTAYKLKGA